MNEFWWSGVEVRTRKFKTSFLASVVCVNDKFIHDVTYVGKYCRDNEVPYNRDPSKTINTMHVWTYFSSVLFCNVNLCIVQNKSGIFCSLLKLGYSSYSMQRWCWNSNSINNDQLIFTKI